MIIAIDGASRRNGKPDCMSAGGAFFKLPTGYSVAAAHELNSTNQRGEIQALIAILTLLPKRNPSFEDVVLVTDSEYVFNTVYKDWIGNWSRKGWKTADNSDVKNQDLWKQMYDLLQQRIGEGHDINIYHIKGHLLSIGKVTARDMLYSDPTGEALYNALWAKYDEAIINKPDSFDKAIELFERNHGFSLQPYTFKQFVVMNTVADYVAGTYIDNVELGLNK